MNDAGYRAGGGPSQTPLAGAILCCTSIPPEQRTELGAVGAQMGATIKLDLTSDVTHLIVGSIDSAKYRYVAKSREDVKVFLPAWLDALCTVWMQGEDVDVAALETQYRLPTFYGLKICLTGFDNPEQRKFIQDTIVQNGAEYHGDLTKNVTHLIAATPSGKKYDHAVSWRMKIVSWEWFEHSCERGMALDEACYHPTLPVEMRGEGAWERKASGRKATSPSLGKRARNAEQSQSINPHRRKLRRAASNKMGSQSQALWAGITAASTEKKRDEEDDWTEENLVEQGIPAADITDESSKVTLLPTDEAQPAADPAPANEPLALPVKTKEGLFEGRVVFTHGFDAEKTNILRQHLDSNGASVPRDPTELSTLPSDDVKLGYLVLPHDAAVDRTSLPQATRGLCLVTNWWVERCLYGKCLVDPTHHLLCNPFDRFGINGFNSLTVHSTGFIGIELLHVTKVVTLMGAKYDEMLSAKTSVMVCNTHNPNLDKLKFIMDKRIAAVHAEWLWECIRTGELQPYDHYRISAPNPRPQNPRQRSHPFAESPTAPFPEEDGNELSKRDAQKPNTSKPRAGHQRPRELALASAASSIPGPPTNPDTDTSLNSFDHNAPPIGAFDGPTSLPLQDINPNVNSPRRPSTSSDASTTQPNTKPSSNSSFRSITVPNVPIKPHPVSGKSRHPRKPTPDSVIPPPDSVMPEASEAANEGHEKERELEKDYSDIMSKLLANRKPASNPTDKQDEKRKRRRQLGRATSTRSNPSTADDMLSRTSSAADVVNEDGGVIAREVKKVHVEYQPSQELGWDAPGAQEARAKMITAMGGTVEEGGSVLEGIGVVKDVVSDTGALGRRKRK
ncbi:hypothetical protein BDV95DRAFT_541299 [Massariosphaeria phaeospora]|uniref:BRCT domain-containing protein n=1 Tax=Massariosphaeria phaeospora TaxID=100035 RepID=A0A7C8I9A5_9PLEO|nr:hypothetical protein BDV95DRAFT_541299 [Massariosphaeria phaeospora]